MTLLTFFFGTNTTNFFNTYEKIPKGFLNMDGGSTLELLMFFLRELIQFCDE